MNLEPEHREKDQEPGTSGGPPAGMAEAKNQNLRSEDIDRTAQEDQDSLNEIPTQNMLPHWRRAEG